MVRAYVLMNTEIGSESRVLEELKNVEGVEDANSLWGVYGIIVSIKAETVDKLKSIITEKIEKIGKVNSKLTLLTSDIVLNQPKSKQVAY